MKANRIFETSLYVDDLQQAKDFYTRIMGLHVVSESDVFLAFRLSHSVLLIFDPALSAESGRAVPSHGATGSGHLAFATEEHDLQNWIDHLNEHQVPIEKIHHWDKGGTSLYIRDPAGNSIEFAPSTLWGGGWDF